MKPLLIMFCLATITGCQTVQAPDLGRGGLSFLRDGQTTREQVLLTLGLPTAQFEGERILVYRVRAGPSNEVVVVAKELTSPAGKPPESEMLHGGYSLVLVFDGRNVVEKHSLVDLK